MSISPNRGVDWSVPETYTFVASQQLYDGRAVTGTASATGLSYHHVFHGDPNVDWRISVEELVGVTQVFVGVDKVFPLCLSGRGWLRIVVPAGVCNLTYTHFVGMCGSGSKPRPVQ